MKVHWLKDSEYGSESKKIKVDRGMGDSFAKKELNDRVLTLPLRTSPHFVVWMNRRDYKSY